MRSRDVIRQGALTYNATEVFQDSRVIALSRAAASGDVSAVRRYVAEGGNPNSVSRFDITPLWWAALAENLNGFDAISTSLSG